MRIASLEFDERLLADVCRAHGVSKLLLFGSRARGTASLESDVDLLVDFQDRSHLSLLRFCQLEAELESLLGHQVDLTDLKVMSADPMDDFKATVRRESIKLYES
ncbi:nucleotidyltransferase [bacterium]|nr:nucleotidyltransferase [bacterium]